MLWQDVIPSHLETISEARTRECAQEDQGLPVLIGCRVDQLVDLIQ